MKSWTLEASETLVISGDAWFPAFATEPLSENFTSEGYWLLDVLEKVWVTPKREPFRFDYWQRQLILRALETYPPGHPKAGELRFRTVLISMARQNGKTVLGAAFGLYGLLRAPGQVLVGIASTVEQARILYLRTLYVIRNAKALQKRFSRLTDTRGIQSSTGSNYIIKASKGEAVQGQDLDIGLGDELHIVDPEVWDGLVSGMGGRPNSIVIGITTAGDDESVLLKRLMANAETENLEEDPNEIRAAYYLWQAEKTDVPDNPEQFKRYLWQANPAVQSGRIDLETLYYDTKKKPEPDVIRYHFNRFIASVNQFISIDKWQSRAATPETQWPTEGRLVIAVDKTPSWEHASFVAAIKNPKTDQIHTSVIAQLNDPTEKNLIDLWVELNRLHRPLWVYDGAALKKVAESVQKKGVKRLEKLYSNDANQASAMLYAKIESGGIIHDNHPQLALQIMAATRRNYGNAYRISKKDSGEHIDTLLALSFALYIAATAKQTASPVISL